MVAFTELNLSQQVMHAINHMGFEETTPIQTETIPLAMEGLDVIGQAHTGTGKTAAFGIPMVERIDMRQGHVQGIVVTPTRELAIQVAEELNKIGQFSGIRTLPIYGGQAIGRQIQGLKKNPQIIVGTPGRLMDHMRRRTLRLQGIEIVVLDEADEMLNMGFIEDIETILKEVPSERQTLLFSATVPRPIQVLAQRFMKNPRVVRIQARELTVPNTEQIYVEVPESKKFDVLCNVLDTQPPELAIIFARTKRRVDELAVALNRRGYSAEAIHGDLSQAQRDSVMRKFRDGTIDLMVATDVAARGLDIGGVTHIFNFDIPHDPEGYVHRIGRTGRAGEKGSALTFVSPREVRQLKNIEYLIKRKINRRRPPSIQDAREGQQRIAIDSLLESIQKGNLGPYQRFAEELLEEHDSVTLLSAALKMLTKEPNTTPISLTQEHRPRPKTHQRKGSPTRKGYQGKRSYQSRGSKGGQRSKKHRSSYKGKK